MEQIPTKAEYNAEHGWASLERSYFGYDEILPRVVVLLNNPGKKQSAKMAYLAARYSRMKNEQSVVNVLESIDTKDIDPAERLAAIQSYGHSSVADQCPITVCLENVPMYIAMRIFNMTRTGGGQERSSRYVDFSEAGYPALLPYDSTSGLFNKAMRVCLDDYNHILGLATDALSSYFTPMNKQEEINVRKRAMDVARYHLPIGINTKVAYQFSARTWAEDVISVLLASPFRIERHWGQLIYDVLVGTDELKELGYVPEADLLIRHFQPHDLLMEKLKEIKDVFTQDFRPSNCKHLDDVSLVKNASPTDVLMYQLSLLSCPHGAHTPNQKYYDKVTGQVANILSEFNNYQKLNEIAQHGAYLFNNYTDLGQLRDIQRHRSMECFIPLLQPIVKISKILSNPEIGLCPYLDLPGSKFRDLKSAIVSHFETYVDKFLNPYIERTTTANEFARFLLPLGFKTKYVLGASFGDLNYAINLRVRPGGHIAYRIHFLQMLCELAKNDPIWKPIHAKLIKTVSISDREQFYNRS